MKRTPRPSSLAISLAGRLALLGIRAELAPIPPGGVAFQAALDGLACTVTWHLATEDPMYWACTIHGPGGATLFRSMAPLPTREGPRPLVPAHPSIPTLHATAPAELVAAAAASIDYAACLREAKAMPEEPPASASRRALDAL